MLTNMRRSRHTSKFSAVLLSSLLTVTLGSASQPAHSLQDHEHGIRPDGETAGDLLSHVRSSGPASPNAEPVDAGDPLSSHRNALQFGPHADVKFPHQIQLSRYFSGYIDKQDNKGDYGDHPLPDEPGANNNKEDNGDHPLPDEPGANVHCWNEAHVFDVLLPASEVAKHFPQECQHPLSCNTTCVAKVPGREVCARLQSGCTAPPLNSVPETQLGTAQNDKKQLVSFEKNVERRLREQDAKITQLLLDSTYYKNKLVELGHNLNHLGDALKVQLAAASVKTLHSLDRNAAEIKSLFNEKSESMTTVISSVLSLVQSDSKTHTWTLKGYAALKAGAIEHGGYWIMCQKVYIGRYLISWGINFKNSPSGVNLHLSFQLHKGISDEFLEWPFSNQLKLSIIHPESGEKQEGRVKPPTTQNFIKLYSRPAEDSNQGVHFPSIKFQSSHLERNGYVKNDQLLLRLEILS